MNDALIVVLALCVIAVGLLGFWVLTKVGFGPTDDPSAGDEKDARTSSH